MTHKSNNIRSSKKNPITFTNDIAVGIYKNSLFSHKGALREDQIQ